MYKISEQTRADRTFPIDMCTTDVKGEKNKKS